MRILFDLHTHTIASGHAFSTLKENIEEAKAKSLYAMGTSDHSISMPGTTHPIFFSNYKTIKDSIMGVRILKSIEVNIIALDGTIDMDNSALENMDYVIASLHQPCVTAGTAEQNTYAVIQAMKNPYVKIIGHPDDDRFPLNYDKLVSAAKTEQAALELNNSSFSERSGRINAHKNCTKMLRLCKKHSVPIVMSSDAHIYYDVGNMSSCEKLLDELDFPKELVLNYSMEGLAFILKKV
ncbi:MAG: phosphatase [Oscillospiraceae bacterium]|jgi:putative hydrolase